MAYAPVTHQIDLLVVEDSRLLRERMVAQLGDLAAVRSTAETADVPSALEMLKFRRFDAVLLDLQLSGGNGLAVLREINKQSPAPAVIVFTTNATPQMRAVCLERGASYFFNKGNGFEPVEEALRQIALRPAAASIVASPGVGPSPEPTNEAARR